MKHLAVFLVFLGLVGLLGSSFSETDAIMNYTQFVEYCDESKDWEAMASDERQLALLCNALDTGFSEKHWDWLDGAELDWNKFAHIASEEYAREIPEFEDAIESSLVIDSWVSGRESFPPPMGSVISFDYDDSHFKKGFRVYINGKLVNEEKLEFTPLQQFEAGITWQNIQCKTGYELAVKATTGHPACIRPESVEILVERGWATTNRSYDLVNPKSYSILENEKTFEILYLLEGARLANIVNDSRSESIIISLEESVGGKLIVSIPRGLMDAKLGGSGFDDSFFVLIDGMEYMYGEKSGKDERVLTIMFPRDAKVIEIIGTNWI